jgi:hypothetical protein
MNDYSSRRPDWSDPFNRPRRPERHLPPPQEPDRFWGRAACALVILLVAVVVGMGLLGQLSEAHLPRVGGVLLPLLVGYVLALALARKKRWRACLGWAAGGLAASALAWLFVPTTEGFSYWSATRRMRSLEEMPAADLDSYAALHAQLEDLRRQYPTFGSRAEQAEKDWVVRFVDAKVARSDKRLASDPAGASAELQQIARRLSGDRRYALVKDRLTAARGRAARAALDAAAKECAGLGAEHRFRDAMAVVARLETVLGNEARALGLENKLAQVRAGVEQAEIEWTVDTEVAAAEKSLATDPVGSSVSLSKLAERLKSSRWFSQVENRLLAARLRAVRATLEAAKKDCRELIKADRYLDAQAAAERVGTALREEAKAVGLDDDLTKFREGYRFLGDLARQAEKPKP